MAGDDKAAATTIVLRTCGRLAVASLTGGAAIVVAVALVRPGPPVLLAVLPLAGLVLVASGFLASWRLGWLTALAYAGSWEHRRAAALLFLQGAAIVVASVAATIAAWLS